MHDPRTRLQRRVPGEDLGELDALVRRLDARFTVEDRPLPIPDRTTRVRETLTRARGSLPTPSPNAPLLIRVVKFPYALSPGRSERMALQGSWRREPLEPRGNILLEAQRAYERPDRASPVDRARRSRRPIPYDLIREKADQASKEGEEEGSA